jgi:hypothetical protein
VARRKIAANARINDAALTSVKLELAVIAKLILQTLLYVAGMVDHGGASR